MLNEFETPEEKCPHCGGRWKWTGRAWMIVDVHGRMDLRGNLMTGEPGPRPDLRRCPICHRPLKGAGQVRGRVQEVTE